MPLLHLNDVVRDDSNRSYKVTRRLGEGQFAEVWEVRLPGADLLYALKLEKRKDRNTVRAEYKIMKKIGQSGGCSQVAAVEGCGVHQERFFMLLQLAGETLYDARKAGHGRLDLPTVKAVGLSTLTAIQQLHEQHVIHRDIKPANFVIDPPNAAAGKGSWLLIDFGLARRYTDEAGSHLPQRSDASFRGSTTYASVHAHKDEDLSRRDDLWSWLYMLTELLEGWLPWRLDKDGGEQHPQDKEHKHWVQQQKELCIEDPNMLSRSRQLPEVLAAISRHLAGLGFADAPNYDHLRQCLQLLPDPQPQLLGLPGQQQQQLDEQEQDGQQWGAVLYDHQQQQHFAQQGLAGSGDWQQQQHWGGAAGSALNGQQQQQMQLSPASPLRDHTPPAGAAAAAAARRPPPGSAADSEQMAKRRKVDAAASSQQRKPGMSSQQQQRSSSTPQRSPADDAAGDSSMRGPTRQQGSTGARQQSGRASDAQLAGQRQAGRQGAQRSRSRSRERQQPPQQQQGSSWDRGRNREAAAAGKPRPAYSSGRAAAGGAAAEGAAKRQGSAAAGAAGVAGGVADEITDYVARFTAEAPPDRQQAVEQAEQLLNAMAPMDTVVVIAKAMQRLKQQTSCAEPGLVDDLCRSLAAFVLDRGDSTRSGASR